MFQQSGQPLEEEKKKKKATRRNIRQYPNR